MHNCGASASSSPDQYGPPFWVCGRRFRAAPGVLERDAGGLTPCIMSDIYVSGSPPLQASKIPRLPCVL
jgi:hypothetical protein